VNARDRSTAKNHGQATVILTLPPPVTGMTLVNQRIVAELQQRGTVTIINLSSGGAGRRRAWKLIRSIRHLGASLRVLKGSAGSGNLYLALNSGPAVALDIVLVTAARVRRRRVFFHHHSFRFINAPSRLLHTLYRIGGDRITDIALCNEMAAGLQRAYGRCAVRVVPNLIDPGEATPEGHRSPGPVRLGHLANLSLEKGVGRVIDAFRHSRAAGLPVELHLAGRFASDDARSLVEEARAEWPEAVFYHGFVSGAGKSDFYAGIDLFLYPTDYAVEAQPLVLLEALSAGVPVLTVDRGCIGSLAATAREGAVTLSTLDDFSERVTGLVRSFAAAPDGGDFARSNAAATATDVANQATAALTALVDEVLGLSHGAHPATRVPAGEPPSKLSDQGACMWDV
jgi:glycosyltransferase involved in cell wall biosynthesis